MARPTHDDQARAGAHAVGLLNELEATMTGWVLGYEREAIEQLTAPLYELLDRDPPAQAVA